MMTNSPENPENREYKKINQEWIDYKNGVRFALIQLCNITKDLKVRIDGQSIKLDVYLKALLNDLDLFIDYGDNVNFVYTEWDKKGTPTKAEVCQNIREYLIRKRLRKVVKLITETIK